MSGGRARVRAWTPTDVDEIVALHVHSWRTTYRGVFSDAFLDHDVERDRARCWYDRVEEPDPGAATFVSFDDVGLTGFVHVVRSHGDGPGALIDNLHVDQRARGAGSATALLSTAANWSIEQDGPGPGHLWVVAANHHAIDVYLHLGAVRDAEETHDDGGGPFTALRMVWPRSKWTELAGRSRS